MASPWKLLARLVSPRRQQRQEHGSTDDVKPDLLAIAKPTETATDDGLSTADAPSDEKPVGDDRPEAVPAISNRSDETANSIQGKADVEDAKPVEATDPALSDDVAPLAREAREPSQAGKGGTPKRSRRNKAVARSEAVPPIPSGVPAVSDERISLDEEIRLLREELSRKLRLQNAQLKRMLERFER